MFNAWIIVGEKGAGESYRIVPLLRIRGEGRFYYFATRTYIWRSNLKVFPDIKYLSIQGDSNQSNIGGQSIDWPGGQPPRLELMSKALHFAYTSHGKTLTKTLLTYTLTWFKIFFFYYQEAKKHY